MSIITGMIGSLAGAGGGGGADLPYVVGSESVPYDTATSMVCDIPAEAQAGDLLVLVGFLRTTYTSPASGWDEQVDRVETGTGEVDQRLVVLTQEYDGVASTVTFGGGSSTRMGVCVTAIRGATTVAEVTESDLNYKSVAEHPYTLPSLANSSSSTRLALQCMTHSYTYNNDNSTESTRSYGKAPVMNAHDVFNNPSGASFSQCRMLALFSYIGGNDTVTYTLPRSSIEDRAAPVIPYATMFIQ